MPDKDPQEVVETEPEEKEPEVTDEDIAEAEKTDPAKAVHMKAQKAKHEPPVGSPRWKEIYKNSKDKDRAEAHSKELEQKLSEKEKDVELLRQHNEQIMELLKTQSEAKVKTDDGVTPQQLLKTLRTEKRKAALDLDTTRVEEIQDQIDDLLIALSQPPKKEDIKQVAREAVSEEDIKGEAVAFSTRNLWLNEKLSNGKDNPDYDFVKAGAAIHLERQLIPQWKGTYRELLIEVEKRINERFAPQTQPKAKVPIVEGVGGGGGGAEKVTLSSEQKRVVANMFPGDSEGEKKYLEQLALINKRGAK